MTKPGCSKKSLFPVSLFFVLWVSLLLMSGVHVGLVVLVNKMERGSVVQTVIPLLYWMAMAFLITAFTRYQMVKTYDEPMKRLAEATKKVARGDFPSISLPSIRRKSWTIWTSCFRISIRW